MNKSYDAIVIGAGIIGCSIAYNLAKKGASVLVLEKAASPGSLASAQNAGGVRQSARDLREMPLAMMAVKLWAHLSDELGFDTEYTQKGNLRLCITPEHMDFIRASVARQQAVGLDVRVLSLDEAREINPHLSKRILGVSYCPTDGHANPLTSTYAYYKAACRKGVEFAFSEEVHSFVLSGGRLAGAKTEKGTYYGAHVVNAAGFSGARALSNLLHSDIPFEAVYHTVFVTEACPRLFEQMFGIATSTFYGRQTAHGSFVWSGQSGLEGTLNRNNCKSVVFRDCIPSACRSVLEFFPVLNGLSVIRSWAGLYDKTQDGVPVLGNLPDWPNFWVASGFSGHGFGIAPSVGLLMAQWMLDGAPELDLSAFAADRFCPVN